MDIDVIEGQPEIGEAERILQLPESDTQVNIVCHILIFGLCKMTDNILKNLRVFIQAFDRKMHQSQITNFHSLFERG